MGAPNTIPDTRTHEAEKERERQSPNQTRIGGGKKVVCSDGIRVIGREIEEDLQGRGVGRKMGRDRYR